MSNFRNNYKSNSRQNANSRGRGRGGKDIPAQSQMDQNSTAPEHYGSRQRRAFVYHDKLQEADWNTPDWEERQTQPRRTNRSTNFKNNSKNTTSKKAPEPKEKKEEPIIGRSTVETAPNDEIRHWSSFQFKLSN